MELSVIKEEKSTRFSSLLEECGVFFAFSKQQFDEGKTPLQEGEKYISLGAGGYMPKNKVQKYLDGSKAIDKWYKTTLKENKLRKQNIIYELNNHEAFYTGCIDDTLSALGGDYAEAEVLSVFREEQAKQENN